MHEHNHRVVLGLEEPVVKAQPCNYFGMTLICKWTCVGLENGTAKQANLVKQYGITVYKTWKSNLH